MIAETIMRRLLRTMVPGMCGVMACLSLAACSPAPQVKPEPVKYTAGEGEAWHSCRFRMPYEAGTAPDWHVDLVLAHRVVAPVLDDYRDDLVFWRFHRRAANDEKGHQFSFIFYAGAGTSSTVASAIMASPWLARLQESGVVVQASCEDGKARQRPDVADSSDANWSAEIQQAWPHFIMGVSEFWLDLIRQIAAEEIPQHGAGSAHMPAVLAGYKTVNEKVTAQWTQQGRHALLHHLNAIFGYSPLLMRY